MKKNNVGTITELLFMREALRDRLIDLVLSSGTSMIIALLSMVLKMDFKNKQLQKVSNLMRATILYTATKPFRKLTRLINELDRAIELLILEEEN